MTMDEQMEEDSGQKLDFDKWMNEIDNMRIESVAMKKLVMDYLISEGFKEVSLVNTTFTFI